MKIPIRFYYDLGASTALLLRFYYALAISALIHVILIKISNRSRIAFQWNGGLYWVRDSTEHNPVELQILYTKDTKAQRKRRTIA